ncbi:MAG: hypothetical protein FWC55_03855, partial [Firmicutes bacterium]|nr:hypothetical protein [Bacillota bacterium]
MNPHPKKYASIATAFALILILSLSSCGGRSAGNGPSAAPSATPAAAPDASAAAVGTVSDYFPDISGKVYSYESPTEPNLNQDVVYAYTNGNRVQRLYKAGGYVMTEVLMIDAGSAALLYADAGGSFEDLTGASSDKIVVILKEPLTKGNKWRGGDGVGCEITDTLARVETPSGGYDCVEMTMTTEAGALGSVSGRTSRIYYAKGVGMVKTAYSLPDGSSYEIDLVKISENAGLTYDMTVYLPGGTGATALRPFTVTTNYDPAAALTAA